MLSSLALWWLALPVLILPIWWHRKKRQRSSAELLATARFLPAAAPEQLRVWRWRELLLLLLRCLLLVTLIAWLAATIFPWRGDTVLLDRSVDPAWAEQQIRAAGFDAASRSDLPADLFPWLQQHEREWRADARLLIVARADHAAMPARLPRLRHRVELRVAAAPVGAAVKAEHQVTVVTTPARAGAWRAMFAAFGTTGGGPYIVSDTPQAGTELIVWDQPGSAPPAGWRAPLWWIGAGAASAMPELANAPAFTINGLSLQHADSPRGRLWLSPAWPAQDADSARAIFESWQALRAAAPAWPAPAYSFAASARADGSSDHTPAAALAWALLALFLLERILSHARRS